MSGFSKILILVIVGAGLLVAGGLVILGISLGFGGLGGEEGPSESFGTIGTGTCDADLKDGDALTPQQIEDFLKKKRAYVPRSLPAGEFPFDATGEQISKAATEFSVNPAFILGIFNAESSFATNIKAHRTRRNRNPGNVKLKTDTARAAGITITGHDDQDHSIFPKYAEGFRGMAFTLKKFYFDEGRTTLVTVAEKYLTGSKPRWARTVSHTMIEVLGEC